MEPYSPTHCNPFQSTPTIIFRKDPLNGWFFKISRDGNVEKIEVYKSIFIAVYESKDKTVTCKLVCDGSALKTNNYYNQILPQWRAFAHISHDVIHEIVITWENVVDFSVVNSLVNDKPVLSKAFDALIKATLVHRTSENGTRR